MLLIRNGDGINCPLLQTSWSFWTSSDRNIIPQNGCVVKRRVSQMLVWLVHRKGWFLKNILQANKTRLFGSVSWIDGVIIWVCWYWKSIDLGSAYPGYPLSSYSLSMLDAIYVRRKWRNLGLASRAISDFITEFPNEDLGFSDPVSQSLLGGQLTFVTGRCSDLL